MYSRVQKLPRVRGGSYTGRMCTSKHCLTTDNFYYMTMGSEKNSENGSNFFEIMCVYLIP